MLSQLAWSFTLDESCKDKSCCAQASLQCSVQSLQTLRLQQQMFLQTIGIAGYTSYM